MRKPYSYINFSFTFTFTFTSASATYFVIAPLNGDWKSLKDIYGDRHADGRLLPPERAKNTDEHQTNIVEHFLLMNEIRWLLASHFLSALFHRIVRHCQITLPTTMRVRAELIGTFSLRASIDVYAIELRVPYWPIFDLLWRALCYCSSIVALVY